MIRIGIFGTDSSHSFGFARFFNVKGEKQHIPGAKVVAMFGVDATRNKEAAERGNVPTLVERPEDMLGMIDAAVIVFRRGSQHWNYAKMCIEAGLPTFIDKPFASSVADAEKIVALARRKRVPISSFSSGRFGGGMTAFKQSLQKIGDPRMAVLTQPGSTRDPFDGIFFYVVHGVEFMLEAFGNDVKSARGIDHDGTLVASVTYKNGLIVSLHEIGVGWPPFTAAAYGDKGVALFEADKPPDGFYITAKVFLRMFQTGEMPLPYDELTISTRVLVAIEKSMKSGGREVTIQ
jgi:predicted dehydrogenase